ncbi:HNH endonuclease signature motif containing protein [Pseudomonas chlororaphis]|uniref:HNH endonuclease signature motif containing protein n=1 Tax=Pseudomonas chlororaphis TaxID=587753 RepID=UPI0023666BE2|nr:HNH endonuclease signature motif containing protein [Pseudomonas chlororaphis]WDH24416.1 HNH endonuclease signature motif containing protein [Pseudomonas chlororaphis]
MRQFERDDVLRAAEGDKNALMRVERRKEILKSTAQQRKLALKSATPSWVDCDAIKALYVEAKQRTVATGIKHEVDHIIPIQGKRVCGLHVPWNLRVVTKAANIRKHAKFGDDDVIGFLTERGYEIVYGVNKLKRAIRIGKRANALLISPGLQESLSIGYVHGEFVIDPGPELIKGDLMPPVAIAWARRPPARTSEVCES